jgi:tetratricopeptide (TPR) repeat protein
MRDFARQREIHERFRLGLDAERGMRWSQAVPEFERILQLTASEPQHSTAAYDLAIAYAHLNRLDDAARALRDAIAGDPEFLAAYANLIAVDLLRHNSREARDYADRFTRLAPDSARALYSRGLAALQQNDPATAAADFSRLLGNDPSYAIAHYDLGIAESRQNHLAEAEREFQAALDLAPQYARARFALATVLLKEGKRTQARAALDATVRDASADPALLNLAIALRDAMPK